MASSTVSSSVKKAGVLLISHHGCGRGGCGSVSPNSRLFTGPEGFLSRRPGNKDVRAIQDGLKPRYSSTMPVFYR